MTMALDNIKIIKKFNNLLLKLIELQGADLHIKSNSPIHARIKGDITLLSKEIVDDESMLILIKHLAGSSYKAFKESNEFDGSYTLESGHRFRVNIFKHLGGFALALRIIPSYIKTIKELNLPNALHKLAHLRRGLVLVTGTTGSGKSTTLATVIEEINRNYPRHIITIEDPIEYEHHDKKSIVEQRELGTHTESFSRALRAAMREDPDIIVVGEIRDLATAESILQAVNTQGTLSFQPYTL